MGVILLVAGGWNEVLYINNVFVFLSVLPQLRIFVGKFSMNCLSNNR